MWVSTLRNKAVLLKSLTRYGVELLYPILHIEQWIYLQVKIFVVHFKAVALGVEEIAEHRLRFIQVFSACPFCMVHHEPFHLLFINLAQPARQLFVGI